VEKDHRIRDLKSCIPWSQSSISVTTNYFFVLQGRSHSSAPFAQKLSPISRICAHTCKRILILSPMCVADVGRHSPWNLTCINMKSLPEWGFTVSRPNSRLRLPYPCLSREECWALASQSPSDRGVEGHSPSLSGNHGSGWKKTGKFSLRICLRYTEHKLLHTYCGLFRAELQNPMYD
jgi:hypothetical protein